jgi:hypothetical protein
MQNANIKFQICPAFPPCPILHREAGSRRLETGGRPTAAQPFHWQEEEGSAPPRLMRRPLDSDLIEGYNTQDKYYKINQVSRQAPVSNFSCTF